MNRWFKSLMAGVIIAGTGLFFMSAAHIKLLASVENYANVYHCVQEKSLRRGYATNNSFWKTSHASEFISIAKAQDGHCMLQTKPGVIGIYGNQSIDACIDRMNEMVAANNVKTKPNNNNAFQKSKGKRANTLRLMKIIPKAQWEERKKSRKKVIMVESAMIGVSILGYLATNLLQNKLSSASIPGSHATSIASNSYSLFIGIGFAGIIGLLYDMYAVFHDPIEQVNNVLSEKIFKVLRVSERLPEVLGNNDLNYDNYVIITNSKLNEHLCDYMHRRIDGKRFCLTCLCDGDHDNANLSNNQFFWKAELKRESTSFVVINLDSTQPLAAHKPYEPAIEPVFTVNLTS